MSSLIELKNISKQYNMKGETVHALKDISLNIDEGEFVAIVGQSGSGKSTLMNILGCLDLPDTGEYLLNGLCISKADEQKLGYIRSQIIGFIFQSFNLIPTLNAFENVELPLIYRGIDKLQRKAVALCALERVGLSERITHRPSELSGGQQQRVAIARVIAAAPEIILADEPTGNLDTSSGREIIKILNDLHQSGRTVVLITHDNSIAQIATRKITVSDGKIINDSKK